MSGPLRKDGQYTIYCIEHTQGGSQWIHSSLDYFGAPTGFRASDDCWQKTGVVGCFDYAQANLGLKWLRERWDDKESGARRYQFRLRRFLIQQMSDVVEEV